MAASADFEQPDSAQPSSADERAFALLFEQCSARVYRFAYGLLRSRPAAEEIVQDCFLKVWERRDQLHRDQPLQAYLFTVAHNLVLNQLRNQRRQQQHLDKLPPLLEESATTPGGGEVEYAELEYWYQRGLEALPPKRRQIFLLSRQYGMSYAEIARELDVSVKTVEAQITQALKFLQAFLRMHGAKLVALPLSWLLLYWL